MDKKEIKSIIEALMFVWGEPLSLNDIASILEINKHDVKSIVDEMVDEFDYNRRGVKIIRIRDKYQLATRSEHHQWISKLVQDNNAKSLSNASLETLSIVAYKQPITRNEIEAIRGVRCDKVLETLIDKKLIKEMGRLQRAGKPIIYGTTDEFLRCFGLEDINDLPDIEKLNKENDKIVNMEE